MKALTKKVALTITSVLLVLSLSLGLVACGGGSSSGGGSDEGELTVLKVGASVTPHAEILANVKDALAAEGFDLQIIEYTDYVKPNLDTDAGDTFANYFQHLPYLEDFNAENGTDLISVAAVHFEPLGIYPGTTSTIESLQDGATIAIPNDTTNEARALILLADQGLITLPENADLTITPRDIIDNPKNLKFLEVDAAAVPRELVEVDLGVINGNNALAADLDPLTVLAVEDVASAAAQTYANILVVKSGSESDPGIQALIKALTSEETRDFITDTYSGVVVPVF